MFRCEAENGKGCRNNVRTLERKPLTTRHFETVSYFSSARAGTQQPPPPPTSFYATAPLSWTMRQNWFWNYVPLLGPRGLGPRNTYQPLVSNWTVNLDYDNKAESGSINEKRWSNKLKMLERRPLTSKRVPSRRKVNQLNPNIILSI